MSSLQIDASTVNEFRGMRDMLVRELERLVEMTRHYPVICTFAGRRWVFRAKQDIVDLIDELNSEIRRFEEAA